MACPSDKPHVLGTLPGIQEREEKLIPATEGGLIFPVRYQLMKAEPRWQTRLSS